MKERLDKTEKYNNININSAPSAYPLEADQLGPCNFKSLKPALTFEEQASKLLEKGLSLDGYSHDEVLGLLSQNNYYRLSGYWLTEVDGAGAFKPGVTLEHIIKIIDFDEELRSLITRMISPIEIRLRTQIAYHLAHEYGAEALYDDRLFLSSKRAQVKKLHEDIDKQIERAKETGVPCVVHNLNTYGKVPIWAAVETLSLSTMSRIYGLLESPSIKAKIAKSFRVRVEYFHTWIHHICYVRNICAHYARLYNTLFTFRPRLLKHDRKYDNARLFSTILLLNYIYSGLWPSKRDQMMGELFLITSKYRDIDLQPIGFPDDWREVVTRRSNVRRTSNK